MEQARTDRWQEVVQQLLAVRRPEQAEQVVRRQLAAHPRDAAAYEHLGLILLNQQHRNAEALAAIRQALALDPQSSDAHYFHGVALLRDGQSHAALQSISEALRLQVYSATYWGYKAVVLNARRQSTEALEAARRGLAIDPGHLECLYQRILALRELQRFREAAEVITQLAQYHPNNALSHRLLGERAQRAMQPVVAEVHFREALRLHSTDDVAQEKLLCLLLDRGEQALQKRAYATAVACFQEALQLNSTLAVAQQLLQQAFRATLWWNKPLQWVTTWKSDVRGAWRTPRLAGKLSGIGRALLYCLLLPFLVVFYLISLVLDWRHTQQLSNPTPTDAWFFGGLVWGVAALVTALFPPWPPLIWLLVCGGLLFPLHNYWLRFRQGHKYFPLGTALLLSPGGNAILKAHDQLGALNADDDCRGFLAFFGVFLLLYQLFRPARRYAEA